MRATTSIRAIERILILVLIASPMTSAQSAPAAPAAQSSADSSSWTTVAHEGQSVHCKKGCKVRYGVAAKSVYNPPIVFQGNKKFTVDNTTFSPDPLYGTVKELQVYGDISDVYVDGKRFTPPPHPTSTPAAAAAIKPKAPSLYPQAAASVSEAIALATPVIQKLPEFDSDRTLLLKLINARDIIRIGAPPSTINSSLSSLQADLKASHLDATLVTNLTSKLTAAQKLITTSPTVSSTP